MSGSPTGDWPRVRVHPGRGLVDRHGDTLLVVPVLPPSHPERIRELRALCRRPDPTGRVRVSALRALLDPWPPAELPGFAVLLRSGHVLRVLVHGPVRVLVDGRAREARPGGEGLAEHVVDDGEWHRLTVLPEGTPAPPDDAGPGPEPDPDPDWDLEAGAVPGAGVTLRRVPAAPAEQPAPAEALAAEAPTSATALRPVVQFRTVPLGECALRAPGRRPAPERRPPLPVADARGGGGTQTRGPEVLVEGLHCPAGHFTDPDLPTCLTCGLPLPSDRTRVTLPRPPLGILVTDGGTIYTVTGDFVIGREPEQAPDVLAGRARPLPLRDTARSTSRVHAHLTVSGWKVLLSDDGSANGTFVSGSGAAGPWLPAVPRTPIRLMHGDRVRLGRRQLLFDTWREAVLPRVFQ